MLVILVVVVIVLVYGVVCYNSLIALIEAVRNNLRQIDVQLDRRYKVFESLIDVVKKSMNYEKTTLKDVVALRQKAQAAQHAGDTKARMDAENQISKIAGGLNVVFENYPDLKANQNALQLQEEIVSTENKLAFSKQAYNDSVENYNVKKKSMFPSLIVRAFSANLDKDFSYWQLDDSTKADREAYTVKMD